jgi:L-ascorbate metabolism protein UlaG (beta-lactamase superfamily)
VRRIIESFTLVAVVLFVLCGTTIVSAATSKTPVSKKGIDFRWLNNAGFEIVLPSGAHVLIDPWLDSSKIAPVPLADIQRADYIILSHIHSDHADDVGNIQKKFPDVRIFVPMLSAEPLAKWQKINVAKLYKVSDGQKFQFDDVKIEVFASRHTESKKGNYLKWDATGELTDQSWGYLDVYNFLITAADGTKFMIWAGTPSVDQVYALKGINPDLAAMHISPKQDFAMLSRIVVAMNPKILMPHHYDIWPFILKTMPEEVSEFPIPPEQATPDTVVKNMMAYVRTQLAKGAPRAHFFEPERLTWYHYDLASKRVLPKSK